MPPCAVSALAGLPLELGQPAARRRVRHRGIELLTQAFAPNADRSGGIDIPRSLVSSLVSLGLVSQVILDDAATNVAQSQHPSPRGLDDGEPAP